MTNSDTASVDTSQALPTVDYRDPMLVVADDEKPKLPPVKNTCVNCRHRRPALSARGIVWPCSLSNMPAATGRCSKWEEGG